MRTYAPGIAAVMLGVVTACASGGGAPPVVGASGRACSVTRVDSAFLALGTVYRDCDVDRPAIRTSMGGHPDFTAVQPLACMSVDLEFIVDEDGKPIPAPLHVLRATSEDFAEAIVATVPGWHYAPAMKDGHPVRQVVHAHEVVQTRVVVAPAGSLPQPMSEAGPPLSSAC